MFKVKVAQNMILKSSSGRGRETWCGSCKRYEMRLLKYEVSGDTKRNKEGKIRKLETVVLKQLT